MVTKGPRISAGTLEFVESCSRVLLSSVTFYEIGQKVRLGKWPSMEPYVRELESIAEKDGIEIMALTGGLALNASLLDWPHRDPFDRMIASSALQEKVPVVSSDAAFDQLGLERIWERQVNSGV